MTTRLPALRLARIGLVAQLVASLFLAAIAPPIWTAEALQPEPLTSDVTSDQLTETQRTVAPTSPRAVTADTYWTTELVDPGSGVGLFSSLAIDSSDDLHVGYYETTSATLRYAVFTDTTWITTTVDADVADILDVGPYASIALDSDDQPRISYYDATSTALRYARKEAGWIESQVDNTASVGQYTSLAFNGTTPFISYYDATNNTLKLAQYDTRAREWVSETVDANPGVGQYTAIDLARYPHIVYYDAGNDQLKFVKDTSSGWDLSDVNQIGDGGRFTSLALDSNIHPHVSYFSSRDQVVYAYHDGADWFTTTIATAGSEATMHTSIVVDADDVPHIAYTDNVGSGHLTYAYLDGSTWVTETVENANVEGYPSIALDAGGLPHITYQSSTGLKHAWLRLRSDLVVTDIWDDGGQVWYQVQNVGQGTAPAGHQVALTVDSVSSGTGLISDDLAPGERYAGVVTTTWTCSDVYDTLVLTADSGGVVVESDETNNVRQETWNCDTTAPTITSGPTATSVTTNSATIQWTTDEDSDSYVYYDPSFIDYTTYAFEDGVYVTSHSIQLTGLEPGTVYRYVVESRDPDNDKTVTSGESFFETAALPSAPFAGTITYTRSSSDYPSYDVVVEIDTSASRAVDPAVEVDTSAARALVPIADHVMLQVDDVVVGTAYAPNRVVGSKSRYSFTISPSRLGLARDDFFVDPGDPTHDLEATVVSSDVTEVISETFGPPREEIPVDVTLLTPSNNNVYYADEYGDLPDDTTIQMAAEAIQYEWECQYVSFRGSDPYAMPPDCGDVAQQVAWVAFYVDDSLVETKYVPSFDFTYVFHYDASLLEVGSHTLYAVALPDFPGATLDDARFSNIRTIHVEQGDPTLSVERTVTRLGNSFEVALDISLADEAFGPVLLDSVVDHADELMPASQETPTYTVSLEYPDYLGTGERRAEITIDFGSGGNDWIYLAPGGSYRVTYELVPILYEYGQANPRIGTSPLRVYHKYDGEDRNMTFELPWQSLPQVQNALGTSDYILVTNPDRLHDLYVEENVHSLLGTMAHLATVRNGVLGFLEGYVGVYADTDNDVLRDLTQPGGHWAEALHPNFQETVEGYMLIVGETEVVPAFDSHDYDICWDTEWGSCVDNQGNDVYQTDQWYSSTSGGGKPELVVGRIIGNTAAELQIPIETSIAVSQGWYAYNYQAPGDATILADPSESVFWDVAQDISEILADKGWDAAPLQLPEEDLSTLLNAWIDDGWSLIHLAGHGTAGSWSSGALSANSPVDFGGYAPFVFGTTCLTGKYEGNADNSLAERMLQWGAAVYIGSTQVSPGTECDNYSKWFYEHDWSTESDESIGRAFAQLERDKWSSPGVFEYDWARFWVVEYNLYGDPRFGASAPVLSQQADAETATAPTTALSIQVPDYVITTTVDGFDQVEIPGGSILFANGEPEIPYWTTSVDYAPGYRVQDVTLDLRSGYTTTTGLDLPTTVMTYYTSFPVSGGTTQTLSLTEDDEWFPVLDQVYDWDVTLNPDGSSELMIHIFPFHYQPATTNVEWYDAYTFTVDVISSTIDIDGFELSQGTYEPSDVVTGDLWFENPGAAQDLILDVTVENLVTGDIVDALPLDALPDVAGPSIYQIDWDSAGIDPGQYLLWVDLLDNEGNLLDSASDMFRLGVPRAEIAAFSAAPDLFHPGDPVDISMTISNTGSSAVSGEAIVKVFATGVSTPTAVFSQTVTDLAPGDTFIINEVWATTAITEEEYRVIGYLKYDARTTEVETAVVSTRAYIYLPLVLRE